MSNIKLLIAAMRKANWKKLYSRNILFIDLVIIALVLGFFVGNAFANEDTKPKVSIPSQIQKIPEFKPSILQTTTTTTTTVAPPSERNFPAEPEVAAQTVAPQETIVYDTSNIEGQIRESAQRHGLDPNRMVRIAICESGMNPGSVASNYIDGTHPTGLFQHVAKYWPKRATTYGFDGASIFDATAQIEVTMGMFVDGQSGQWSCK